VEVFNAISANNDGRNEILYIRGLDCFTDNNVTVYNRWGVVVYEVDGYNNEDKSFRGYSEGRVTVNKNEKLPDGTYYYVLRYKDLSGNAIEKVGYLYISNN
jgi:gliding motility-associated-like protein